MKAGKVGMMNRAQELEPESGHDAPAKAKRDMPKRADVAGAMGNAGNIGAAVRELAAQHPEMHDDLGPHHGGKAHIRHKPMKMG